MATGVLDEHLFKGQCSLYEPVRIRSSKEQHSHRPTTAGDLSDVKISPPPTTRVKYSTQTSISSSNGNNSIHNRHSVSGDLMSLIRSFAMKPFKAASLTSATAGGQTSNIVSGSNTHAKSQVNLVRYRPLSDGVTDHVAYTHSTRAIDDFLKRMAWPTTSSDESRVKWNTAMKFLFPTKFDVNRAITLYRTHEHARKNENLDRIWIKNPNLIREIQSNKFITLPLKSQQPLTVIFAAAITPSVTPTATLSQQDRDLITLQALICQLDVATENPEVQQHGLNFIYDMQNCSASQFDMNLTKKILKLLQGTYPAMLKNLFIISAPKWFKFAYKVTFHTPEQMRDYLSNQSGYALEDIPISLGGTFDPSLTADLRYQNCLAKVTDSQSICYNYYSLEYQSTTVRSSNNILFVNNNDHHSPTPSSNSSSPTSLFAIVTLRRNNHESSSSTTTTGTAPIRVRKRESSSSSDNEKRRRSNESLIEEEPLPINSTTYLWPEHYSFDPQQSSDSNENSHRSLAGQQQQQTTSTPTTSDHETATTNSSFRQYAKNNNMTENDNREHGILRRDPKRTAIAISKPLNAEEFLSKTISEMKHEFRKLSNPPAKDTHAAKEERNIEKSRYRDVIPGEATRVKLQLEGDDRSDFINANYVSGYNHQEKAYIFTQGPLQSTVKDFWRMVWQEDVSVIVMTTNIRESGTMKCFPYWPMENQERMQAGIYQIYNEKQENFDSFIVTTLTLKKKNHPEKRTIYHAHYLKWPDHGVPVGTKDALLFLEKVEYYRQLTMPKAPMPSPPVLLHCSAGIGRTGTFCAIDIGIKRFLEKKIIDMPMTVTKMRTERAGSVQTEDQYVFAHLAMMDYIQHRVPIDEQQPFTDHTSSIGNRAEIQTTDLPGGNKADHLSEQPFNLFDANGIVSKKETLLELSSPSKESSMLIHKPVIRIEQETDDTIRRSKIPKATAGSGKKSIDLEQSALHSGKKTSIGNTNSLQEPTYRAKTLSDSSAQAIQLITPSSTSTLRIEPSRQRASTGHISPLPSVGAILHKKARK